MEFSDFYLLEILDISFLFKVLNRPLCHRQLLPLGIVLNWIDFYLQNLKDIPNKQGEVTEELLIYF